MPAAGHVTLARFPEHGELVRELFVEYAAQIPHDLDFQHFDHELDTLPGSYASPRGAILLARFEGSWAGCVALRPLTDGVCEMKRLYVRPAFRRSGLGRHLAREVIAFACEQEYRSMRLDTLATMRPARTLYESLGFAEIPAYYNNPIPSAVYYELQLPPSAR